MRPEPLAIVIHTTNYRLAYIAQLYIELTCNYMRHFTHTVEILINSELPFLAHKVNIEVSVSIESLTIPLHKFPFTCNIVGSHIKFNLLYRLFLAARHGNQGNSKNSKY